LKGDQETIGHEHRVITVVLSPPQADQQAQAMEDEAIDLGSDHGLGDVNETTFLTMATCTMIKNLGHSICCC
jgi:hypothetical protein